MRWEKKLAGNYGIFDEEIRKIAVPSGKPFLWTPANVYPTITPPLVVNPKWGNPFISFTTF